MEKCSHIYNGYKRKRWKDVRSEKKQLETHWDPNMTFWVNIFRFLLLNHFYFRYSLEYILTKIMWNMIYANKTIFSLIEIEWNTQFEKYCRTGCQTIYSQILAKMWLLLLNLHKLNMSRSELYTYLIDLIMKYLNFETTIHGCHFVTLTTIQRTHLNQSECNSQSAWLRYRDGT